MPYNYGATYPIAGSDKHHGKTLSAITITVPGPNGTAGVPFVYTAWQRASKSGTIDTMENTNAGSDIKTFQTTREEPPVFEIEFDLPYNEDGPLGAAAIVKRFRAGVIMTSFQIGDPNNSAKDIFSAAYLNQFGKYIIEKASIDVSRDSATTVKATIRALGYTNANVDF